MSSNKRIREKVEQVYGKGCMFKKAGIEKRVEKIRTIKTYRKFLEEKKYTSKKIKYYESIMTYHHLKHKSEDRWEVSRKWCSSKLFSTCIYA